MARGMDRPLADLGQEGDATIRQLILNTDHAILIAGDGARRENNGITAIEFHKGILAFCNPRESGLRLALAAGPKCQHIFTGYRPEIILIHTSPVLPPPPGIPGALLTAVARPFP